MGSQPTRPTNLNFFTLHFPITAWVSILHRLSGIFVFLLIPVLLWALQESLGSKADFEALRLSLKNPIFRWGLWALLAALLYHFVAGLRHLLMDIHVGETKMGGRISSWLVLSISLILFLGAGYWLWLK